MPKKRTFNSNAIYVTEKVRVQLHKIPSYPCTIIEAPMGYGKTTAVREYLKSSDCTILWQKIFNHSISGFWSMFCRQVRSIDAGAAEHLTQLGFPGDSTTREKALDLIQGALPSGGSIWVIDDYHLADCPEIAGFIEYLLWNELSDLHIVLSARHTHFDNLEEMTLKGYVNLIQKDALELDLEDIISYYRLCGIALKEKDSRWLESYTEGWITGLYLLMLSYQSEGVFEATANITALIDKTIYAPFSEEIKEFLMTLCFFEAFSQEQAAHMWEKNGSTELLQDISGRNGFIVWDARNEVYQVHKIFSQFLRGIFDRNSPEEKRKLYGRAASWYKNAEDYLQAMEYYQLAQDYEGLLTALQLDQGYSMHNEHREKLISYIEACPEKTRRAQPFALLVYALCLFSYNETERFASVCAEIANLLESGKLEPETARELAGEFEVLQSFSNYNDIEKMLDHYKRAGELMGSPARFMDTRGGWTFGSPSILYMFHRKPGELARELNLMKEAMPFYDGLAKGHGRGAEFVMEAERDYFRGDLDSAEIAAYKAYLLSEGSKQEDILLSTVFLQAKIDLYKGNYGMAKERLKYIREDLEHGGWYNLIHTMELCEGWIQLCLGRKQDV
ncbi:MAG: ATP-dependent transcriptional regulator, partial [Bacillota bacterium]|nr:ATP-dependent transcriptional regulator [Bacillota bacterium]